MLTKAQMMEEYEVLGFAMGYCVVKRRSDGVKGTLMFGTVNDVRYYHDFQEA